MPSTSRRAVRSHPALAAQLNREGVPAQGARWHPTTVADDRSVLLDRWLRGCTAGRVRATSAGLALMPGLGYGLGVPEHDTPVRSLGKVVVELRYPQAGLFFDRRGQLLDNLRRGVGREFAPTVGPDHVSFATEALRIRCDAGKASVTHEQPGSPVRAEEYAGVIWKALNETGLPKDIARLGTRFFVWWRTDSEEEARRLIKDAGFGVVPPRWKQLFGEPTGTVTVIANYEQDGMSARVSLDSARNFLIAEPTWLDHDKVQAHIPAHVVQLDVDVFRGDFRARPDEVAGLVRSHWQLVAPWAEKLDAVFAEAAARGTLPE